MNIKFTWVILALTIFVSCQKLDSPTTVSDELIIEEAVSWGDPTIVAGDVILTEKQVEVISDYNESLDRGEVETRGAFPSPFTRWPNCVVYYKFDTNDPIRSTLRTLVLNIMQELEDNTRIEFRYAAHMAPRSSYVLIKAGGASQATIGFGSSAPVLELLDRPSSIVTRDRVARPFEVRHEIGHVVGLIHEHQRSDRDNFINVDFGNIDCFNPFLPKNFDRLLVTYLPIPSNNVTPFDLMSIMIYASCACADTGSGLVGTCNAANAVLTTPTGGTWGNRMAYTASDFAAIDAIYTGCAYSGGGGGGPIVPGGGPIQ